METNTTPESGEAGPQPTGSESVSGLAASIATQHGVGTNTPPPRPRGRPRLDGLPPGSAPRPIPDLPPDPPLDAAPSVPDFDPAIVRNLAEGFIGAIDDILVRRTRLNVAMLGGDKELQQAYGDRVRISDRNMQMILSGCEAMAAKYRMQSQWMPEIATLGGLALWGGQVMAVNRSIAEIAKYQNKENN